MSKRLFKSPVGFADDGKSYLSGTGAPGADASYEDAAPVGSEYSDLSTGLKYIKDTAGTGTDKWAALAVGGDLTGIQNEVDAIETALGAMVDGTGAYVAHTTSSFIDANSSVTEDLLDLDSELFDTGTNVGNLLSEVDAIEAAMGAVIDGNGDYVAHTTSNYIDGNTSVTTDLLDLDTQVKANADAISAGGSQAEIDAIEAALGAAVDVNGDYVAHTTSNYIDANADVTEDLLDLDTQAKANADAIALDASQAEVDAIEAALGAAVDANGDYVAHTGSNYIDGNADVTADLLDLDAAAAAAATAGSDAQAELDLVEAALGAMVGGDGNYVAHTTSTYIDGNADVTADLLDLDVAIAGISNTYLPLAGGTMDLNANVVFNGGEVLGLPSTPAGPTYAASKAYVDAQAGGVQWVDPCWYIDLISDDVATGLTSVTRIRDLQTPANDTPDIALAEDSDMYIVGAGASDITLRAVGTTGNIVDVGPVSAGDVIRFDADLLNGGIDPTWEDKGHITTFPDMRGMSTKFIRARWGLNISTDAVLDGAFTGADDNIVELVHNDVGGGGASAYSAYWGIALSGGVKEICHATTIAGTTLGGKYLTDTVSVGPTYPFSTTASIWFNTGASSNPAIGTIQIEVAINASDDADQVAAAIKTAIEAHTLGNALYSITVAGDSVTFAHRHYGDITDIGVGDSGFSVDVPTQGADAPIPPAEGVAFYIANTDSMSFGKQFTYVAGTVDSWVEIGATVSVSPGNGLGISGNIMYVNMGAGIVTLPSDEVGVDIYTNKGLFLTEDGSTPSTGTDAQLAVKVDGTTVSVGASGISVHADVIAEINAIESSLGAMVGTDGVYVAHTTSNYIDGNADVTADLLDLDTQAKANADGVAFNANEIDNLIESGGGGTSIDTDGTWLGFSGTDYIDTAASLAHASWLLDNALAVSDGNITNIQTEVDAIETSFGAMVGTDGVYVAHTTSNYIDGNADFTEDLLDLDTQLGTTDTELGNVITSMGNGVDVDGSWLGFSDTFYLDSAAASTHASYILDQEIGKTGLRTQGNNGITTAAQVDAVKTYDSELDHAQAVKWLVVATNAARSKKVAFEVFALHDGDGTSIATSVDFNDYGKLKIGSTITGFAFDVVLVGAGSAQTMALEISSTEAVDISVTRLSVGGVQ